MKIITSSRGKTRGTRVLTKPVRMAQSGGQSPEILAEDSLGSLALRIIFFILCVSVISFLSACKNKKAPQEPP